MKQSNSMIKSVFLTIMLSISTMFVDALVNFSYAQESKKPDSPIQHKVRLKGDLQKGKVKSSSTEGTVKSYTNEDDLYQGRSKEIIEILTVNKVPEDFPIYEKGKGTKWYNDKMNIYYRNHPEILKEIYKQKLGIQ